MGWPAVTAALLVGLLTAATTPWVLRRLREPPGDDPDLATKIPYARLPTRGFVLGVGVGATVTSGIAFAATPTDTWPAWLALSSVGVLAVAVDARTTWLPLSLTRAATIWAVAGVLIVCVVRRDPWPGLAAAGALFGLWLLFELFWRLTRGIGYGDVRLMASIGAVTGVHDLTMVLPSALVGTVVGLSWGLAHRARRTEGPFPYGPALLSGPFLVLLWGLLAP